MIPSSNQLPNDDLDRPVWGAREFAPILRRTERQVHYLLERGLLDASKTGKFWTSTKRRLLGRFGGVSA